MARLWPQLHAFTKLRHVIRRQSGFHDARAMRLSVLRAGALASVGSDLIISEWLRQSLNVSLVNHIHLSVDEPVAIRDDLSQLVLDGLPLNFELALV